ncbi:MAG: hypothetical protein LBK95_03640 [Bifidobacteriaceae bacterium]|nr:hypothetical protein [Bifidobacteriaceae bacterium]
MDAWRQGRATIDQLLETGLLERVPADLAASRSLVERARVHLRSAATLADQDVELAYDALHTANRKALAAVLLAEGLRPTREGGHIALHEAVRAQLDPPLGRVLAPYTRIRRVRNAGAYRDEFPHVAEDVRQDLPLSRALVDACAAVLGQMPVY